MTCEPYDQSVDEKFRTIAEHEQQRDPAYEAGHAAGRAFAGLLLATFCGAWFICGVVGAVQIVRWSFS